MRTYDEKRVTNVQRVHIKTNCDKCGVEITPNDEVSWVNYSKYVDDGATSFQLCYNCNEELLNNWLINYDYD